MLRTAGLFCERDDRVLFEALDFELFEGEVLQVLGSNGSGKTSLLRILCGLNDSYEGEIFWYDADMAISREAFLAALLFMGHKPGVNKILSPRENLRWSSALQQRPPGLSALDAAIDQALAAVGLAGYEDSPCHNLSAGQQKRVSLARLYLSPARLWVLDEPFTALDVYGVKDLERLLAAHVERGGAVLVTTHHKLELDCPLRQLNLDEKAQRMARQP